MKDGEETTYALLRATQKEEKRRDAFETGVYGIYIVTAVVAIWQFAAVAKPLPKVAHTPHHNHPHKVHMVTGSRPS